MKKKQPTRKELRELFKDEPIILDSLEKVWGTKSTISYFRKPKHLTREELKEAFKNRPIILNALMDVWHPKAKCEVCSAVYRKKIPNQKYCSKTCQRKSATLRRRGPRLNKRDDLREAFKNEPSILKALEESWTIEVAECYSCDKEFNKTNWNQRYCSHQCKNEMKRRVAKSRRSVLTKEQILSFNEAATRKFLSELKDSRCHFCNDSFKQHKTQRAKYCCDFCRKAAVKFRVVDDGTNE